MAFSEKKTSAKKNILSFLLRLVSGQKNLRTLTMVFKREIKAYLAAEKKVRCGGVKNVDSVVYF